jgi:putative oxidoreductase
VTVHTPSRGQLLGPTAHRMVDSMRGVLSRYSIDMLRVSLGLVFLGFGSLKFIPNASPAEELAKRTLDTLTFGLIEGSSAVLLTAAMEVFIGLTLVTGKLLKTGLVVLAGALVGIMSPLVLFFGDLFPGWPTLEAQYVLKDIILASAGLVVGAKALGARLVPPSSSPAG